MDLDLLLSPQLHTLEYTVSKEVREPWRDEMHILAQILQRNAKLKILRLNCENGDVPSFSALGQNPHGLTIETSRSSRVASLPLLEKGDIYIDRLPCILEELSFLRGSYSMNMYDLGNNHCLALKQCLDWSKLVKLDLGHLPMARFHQVFLAFCHSLKSFTSP